MFNFIPVGYYALSGLFNFITTMGLCIFVFFKETKSRINQTFCLFTLSIAGWSFFYFLWLTTGNGDLADFYLRTSMLFVIFIPPTFTHFVLTLLRTDINQRMIFCNYLVSVLIGSMVYTSWFARDLGPYLVFPYWLKPGPIFKLHLLHFIINMAYSHFLMLRAIRNSVGVFRNQVLYVFIGLTLGYGAGIMHYLTWYRMSVPPFLIFLVSFSVAFIGYSIIKYRFMDISTVIHKTAMWVVTSAAFAVPIGLVLYATKRWIDQLPLWQFLLMIAGLFVLSIPYMRLIQPKIDHLFQRRLYDLRVILDRFIRDVAIVKSIPELSEKLVGTIRTVLYAEPTTLLLWQPRELQYVATDGSFSIRADDAWLVWLRKQGQMVELAEVMAGSDRSEVDAAKAYAARTNALFCLPIHRDGQLIGVVNVGPKQNLQRYTQPEREFLETLRAEASIALTNSLLYDEVRQMSEELRQWGLELEERVEQKTRELKETQSQLIQAEKLAAHGLLAAGVLHEINNPLSFSRGSLSVLKRALTRVKEASQGTMGPLLGEVERAAEIIQNGHERIAAIVRDLKMFAKRDVEGIKLCDLHQGLDATLSLLRHELGDRITIVRDYGDIGLVEADSAQINQVFLNLIHNALQAISEFGSITIKTWKDGERVFVSIKDTGVGIDSEHLARIFEPFFTTKPVGHGTGLGLSVSHRIVAEHSGQMVVQSFLGRGTEFVIELPARQTAAAAHAVR
jgi:signal transduction histidine kinase